MSPLGIIAGIALVALVGWVHLSNREADSTPVTSGDLAGASRVFQEVINDLGSRSAASFCTFECVDNPLIWFQINGADLAHGAAAWPDDGVKMAEKLRSIGQDLPAGFEELEDKNWDPVRVILFNTEPLSTDVWVEFLKLFFGTVHGLPPNARIKGWVTRAE